MKSGTPMFDLSNPQQRERLLVVCAIITLFVLFIGIVPGQFTHIRLQKVERDNWRKQIEEHEQTAQDKDEIQRRLAAMQAQALAEAGTPLGAASVSGYQAWLMSLATSAELGNPSSGQPGTAGSTRGAIPYVRHTFSISAEGRLDQIAEFLRRFHRTEYLHIIQSVQPFRQLPNQAGVYAVTFRIEALSLPQIRQASLPSSERNATPITDEERQKLDAIRDRAILSEYRPPAPSPPENGSTTTPAPPVFDDIAFCYLIGITETDGRPECWIFHRTRMPEPRTLREGETFILAGVRCIIRKISVEAQQIHVDIGGSGTLYSLQVGKNFDEVDEVPPEPDVIVPESNEPVVVSDSENNIAHCFLIAAVEENGRLRCHIRNRTTRTVYTLSEGGVFLLAGIQCTVKGIDINAQQVIVNIGGGLYVIGVGQHFDQVVAVESEPDAPEDEIETEEPNEDQADESEAAEEE